MINVGEDLLRGLPDELRPLLAAPPVTEKKLLELSVTWTGLPAAPARAAEWLRLFVITWDPLERQPTRPDGFATVNVGPGVELVVYLPFWSLVERAAGSGDTIAEVLAAMAGSAVVVAVAAGQPVTSAEEPVVAAQPPDVRRGRPARRLLVPDLLSDPAGGLALGHPAFRLVSAGWDDIGLGAITDVVQHAFGPVDLDRSPVMLAPAAGPDLDCPAGPGRPFGFPAGLAEAAARMCPPHRAEAGKVIRVRLARANLSNPDGWAALTDASARLSLSHLPNGLARKLAGAEDSLYVVPEPAELAEWAQAVVEAAAWFPGRRDDFAVALGVEPDFADLLPDWLMSLIPQLGRAGFPAQASMVAEALALVDPELRSTLESDVAVALADAGLGEQARARIAANLERWPADVWVRMHAGDALAALGDLEGAASYFEAARILADETDDFEAAADALERLRRITRSTQRTRPATAARRGRQPSRRPRAQRKRK